MVVTPSAATAQGMEMPVISWSTRAERKSRRPSARLRVTMNRAEAVRLVAPPNRRSSTS